MAPLDQDDHAAPFRTVWLEELEHPVIVGSWFAGEQPRHGVRKVIVPNRDGVTVPPCHPHDVSSRPRPDAPNRTETLVCRRPIHLHDFFEAFGPPGDLTNDHSPTPLDPVAMKLLVVEGCQLIGTQWHLQPGRPRRRIAERGYETVVAALGLPAGDSLTEDCRHDRLEHLAGGAEVKTTTASLQLVHRPRPRIEDFRSIVAAQQPRSILQLDVGPGAPRLDDNPGPVPAKCHLSRPGVVIRCSPMDGTA